MQKRVKLIIFVWIRYNSCTSSKLNLLESSAELVWKEMSDQVIFFEIGICDPTKYCPVSSGYYH